MVIHRSGANNDLEGKRFDVAVIGAGTLGLLLTARLVERGLRVCVVEAGGGAAIQPGGAFKAQSLGKHHAGVELGRAIGLGGTSTLWGGQLAMFTPEDFARPGHEWPISFEEVRPWYDEACLALGIPAPRKTDEYLSAFGIPPPDGSLEPFFAAWLPQPNMARQFRSVIEGERADILLDTHAFAFDFDNDRAKRVRLMARDGTEVTLEADHFIMAAGTIANVQLAMSAGCHGQVPWANNRLIGAYFHDHLGAKAASVEVLDDVAFHRMIDNGIALGTKLQVKFRKIERSVEEPSVCGYFGFRSSYRERISELKRLVRGFRSGLSYTELASLPRSALSLGRILIPIVARYLRQRRIFSLYDQGVDFLVQAEQWPDASSRIVATTQQPDASGLLPVALEWHLDGREAASIRDFVHAAAGFFSQNGLARLTPEEWVEAGPAGLTTVEDTYHQSGGMRMAWDALTGVTDKDCTIFGTSNVSVAGAGVFPTSSYANVTFTAMALALRLADHVALRLRPGA